MNLPNKLTLLRIALVPVFVALLLCADLAGWMLPAALAVFVIASLTDMLDGKIARKHNLITTFGKLMDPLADKVLVMSAMVCFVALGWAPAWVVVLILSREFLVTSLRLVAAGAGQVIAADSWGKMKTVSQMLWVICTLLWQAVAPALPRSPNAFGSGFCSALMAISVVFTLLSGFNYVWKNRALLSDC